MAAVVFKQFNLFFNAVINADVIAVDTDRPVNRVRADAQYLLDFVHQIKRVAAVTVKLVYKGKYRQLPAVANPEQLFRLRFHALGAVNKHYGAVSRHQSAVGIFRKVLMARCIQNVYAVAVIIKLQNGACYGNAALLFNFHPVRNGMAVGFTRLNRTGKVNCAAVQQKFFRQRRFTGVRMRYNGKSAAFFNLFK